SPSRSPGAVSPLTIACASSATHSLPGFRGTVSPVPDRLRRLQLDHSATQRGRCFLLSMGTLHSIRSVHGPSLHVDRSFLCRSAISLPDRSGIIYIFSADYRSDCHCGNLFSPFPSALRLSTPTRERLDRHNLRLVSGNGRALQSFSVTTRRALVFSCQYLCPSSSRRFPGRGNGLVCTDRALSAADLSTSHHRHRRRIRAGRLLLLLFSRLDGHTAGN